MTRKASDKIAEGLHKAIAVARRRDACPVRPATEIDVKAVRRPLATGVPLFLWLTVEQIRSWKQKRARPLGGVRVYFMMIDTVPEGVGRILQAA
jgi:hypothetical protein